MEKLEDERRIKYKQAFCLLLSLKFLIRCFYELEWCRKMIMRQVGTYSCIEHS